LDESSLPISWSPKLLVGFAVNEPLDGVGEPEHLLERGVVNDAE
jgi:hypothetical protein